MFRLRGLGWTALAVGSFFSAAAFAATAATSPSSAATASPASPESGIPEVAETQLKAAVTNVQAQLGTLDPTQKRIFDEEVVPQYALFIKDYKRVGQTFNIAVDVDAIKNITRFSAQKTLNQAQAKILLYLNADTSCEKCSEEAPAIRKMMEMRVQRRGLSPVWVSAEELSGSTISDLVGPHGTVGFMQVDLVSAPPEDADSTEKQYLDKSQLEIRGIASYHDQAELFETGSFEDETQKLLTHAFAELGAKADLAGISATSGDDMLIEVSKVGGFSQYSRLRSQIQSRLKGVALVDERKIARGNAVFALKTKKSVDEVKNLLKGTSVDDNKEAVVVGSNAQAIQMEIR